MKADNSLLVASGHPSKAGLVDEGPNSLPVIVDGFEAFGPCRPPWPACAELLYDRKSREFIGLAYFVHPSNIDCVRPLIASYASPVVQYGIGPHIDDNEGFTERDHFVDLVLGLRRAEWGFYGAK
jgi:hypothetical protein